jgi:hypothetical protein
VTAAQSNDYYNRHLQDCLTKYLKAFESDILHSDNPLQNIKRKIKFIKWVLKEIKSNEKISYETLIIMVDTEIIIYKRKLQRASTRPMTFKVFDAIQHLEWLRTLLSSTRRRGFNDILIC